ncbi:hypothetical protein PROFUN_01694 [Planoprotostelium fungivorum]|uniref:Ankyrin repeat protein n=1 Tax=Planoprotostelium fungivorum TaxID=1890364 RepID=A0A2P6MW87_9EUKA|nr:hypothetical protein PROFUN_01694 [Planoprotostelium fungivorum]
MEHTGRTKPDTFRYQSFISARSPLPLRCHYNSTRPSETPRHIRNSSKDEQPSSTHYSRIPASLNSNTPTSTSPAAAATQTRYDTSSDPRMQKFLQEDDTLTKVPLIQSVESGHNDVLAGQDYYNVAARIGHLDILRFILSHSSAPFSESGGDLLISICNVCLYRPNPEMFSGVIRILLDDDRMQPDDDLKGCILELVNRYANESMRQLFLSHPKFHNMARPAVKIGGDISVTLPQFRPNTLFGETIKETRMYIL